MSQRCEPDFVTPRPGTEDGAVRGRSATSNTARTTRRSAANGTHSTNLDRTRYADCGNCPGGGRDGIEHAPGSGAKAASALARLFAILAGICTRANRCDRRPWALHTRTTGTLDWRGRTC